MIPILFKDEDYLIQLLQDGNNNILEDGNSKMLMIGKTPIGFQSHGLGSLSDAISCEVEEERNGSYELTMEYPITGVHFSEIEMRSIILAKPNYLDSPQPFRVYQIDKPINGKCTIYARHWSYDLSDVPVQPFTASGIQSALNGLIANAMYDVSNWNLTTSRATASNFKVDVPSSIRSWFGGKAGSLLDVYGGEWHYDGRTCSLENSRGSDRGVTIRYGVNLTELKQEENCASCYTGVLPFWSDEDGNVVRGTVQEVSGTFDYVKVYVLDCSNDFEETPTAEQLNAKAVSYIENNNIGVPKVNLTLNFVMLQGLLNRVDLCDTVRVIFEKLGVEATAKCIRVRWNVLLDRYEEAEFGDAKTNITDSIIQANNAAAENAKSLRETATVLQNAIENAVQKISGNLGGYVILHDTNDDGYPDELLIMDTPDITTATNVWRWNQQGLMHANSYTGTYANAAITMDGQIVADAITTGVLRGIELISTDNTNVVDIVNGKITTSRTGAGKTETTNFNYRIYDENNVLMGNFTISAARPNGYRTGILTLDDTNGFENAYIGGGYFRLKDSETGNETAYIGGGALALKYKETENDSTYLGNGYFLMRDTDGNVRVRSDANLIPSYSMYTEDGNQTVYLSSGAITGGTLKLNYLDGTSKLYLGTLSLPGLMTDTPSIAFYDNSGNIKSWYALNRAYIYDDTSGENGYVVHGHSAAHGITVEYGSNPARIEFYVDTQFIGYATITYSDKRVKKGIKSISQKYKDAVGSVDLKSFHFNFKKGVLAEANALLRFGAVAQDVIAALEAQGIDPAESELVDTVGEGKEERYAINYIPFLIARLAADEDRIQKLEEQNKALEERLARLEARIGD